MTSHHRASSLIARPIAIAVLLALGGCQDSPEGPKTMTPAASSSAAARGAAPASSPGPREAFRAAVPASEAAPHEGPADETVAGVAQPPAVPAPIWTPLEDADQRISHTSNLVVSGAGLRLYTGYRVAQSVRLHLSNEQLLVDVPAVRRIDHIALRQAAGKALTIPQVSESLLGLRSVDELKSLRRHLANPAVRSLAMVLTQTVEASGKQVNDAIRAVAESSAWRRDALALVATQVRLVDAERLIGEQVLPYVYQSVGLPFNAKTKTGLIERCDALAVARIQLATQHLNDQDLFTLIQNLHQDRDRLGEVFGLVFDAFRSRINEYLWAYAESFEAASQQSVSDRVARRS